MNNVNFCRTIMFPTFSETEDALNSEFPVICCEVVQQYLKNVSFDENGHQVIDGFVTYKYDEEDGTSYYMCKEFKYLTQIEEFEFGEFIEDGGFDSKEEAEKFLYSKHNIV